jgi:hypothetical protein
MIALLVTLALAQTLDRYPYVQQTTETSAVIVWRTTTAAAGRLELGASPSALTTVIDDPSAAQHAVQVSGLSPSTRYYYAVGTPSGRLAGADYRHAFTTA